MFIKKKKKKECGDKSVIVLIFIYERDHFFTRPDIRKALGWFSQEAKGCHRILLSTQNGRASMFGVKCHGLVSLADEARLKGRWQLGDKNNDAPLRSALYSNITPRNWQIKPNETSIAKQT